MQVLVRVYPRASRNSVAWSDDGSLKVWVTATPESNKANEAVLKLLADRLDVPKSSIRILRGHRTQKKVVRLEGLANEEVRTRVSSAGEK